MFKLKITVCSEDANQSYEGQALYNCQGFIIQNATDVYKNSLLAGKIKCKIQQSLIIRQKCEFNFNTISGPQGVCSEKNDSLLYVGDPCCTHISSLFRLLLDQGGKEGSYTTKLLPAITSQSDRLAPLGSH